MKFLDLFAGIGGFRLGMEQAGHECVGYVEWDKFARLSYQAIHNTEGEWTAHDITTVRASDIPRANIWCFGFPCQDISIAGKQKGFTGNRSSLFFAVTRLIRDLEEENRPEFLLIENVKNLLSINGGWDFAKLQIELDEIGYDCEWDVLNSKEVVPQNRERVFIIGHLRGKRTRKVFPIERENRSTNSEHSTLNTMGGGGREPKIAIREATKKGYSEATVGDSVNISQPNSKTRRGRVGKQRANTLETGLNQGVVVPVITPDRMNKRQNGRRFKENGDPAFTLNTQDRHGVLIEQLDEITKKSRPNEKIEYTFKENGDIRPHRMDTRKSGISELNINHEENPSHTVTTSHAPKVYGESTKYRIRKLTPRECWRLQGFPDWAFDKAQEVNSNSQLYKQAGNSVTVPVIYEIAKRFKFN